MELAKQSLTDLKRLLKRVETEIERRANTTKRDVLKKVHKIVTDAGLSLEELMGDEKKPAKVAKPRAASAKPGRKAGAKKTAGVAKFCNPANTAQTWTGHGRKPGWVVEWLASGKPLSELEIH
jgi:DNA-binding protein H-NS